MSYFTASSVATIDAVLQNITTFLAGLTGWTVVTNMGTPAVGPTAGGHETIAYKNGCLVGLRSIALGNCAGQLWLLDGQGPYTSGNAGSLNGNSGLGPAFYTLGNITSGLAGGGTQLNCRGLFTQVTNATPNTGPYPNMWLFSDSGNNYVHCVLQVDAVNFRHMLFGNILQYGTWTNAALGGYFSGTYWSLGNTPINNPANAEHGPPMQNSVCSDGTQYDWTVSYANGRSGDTSKWLSLAASTNSYQSTGTARRFGSASVRGGMNRTFKNQIISNFSGLVPLAPVVVLSINDAVTPNTVNEVGQIPDFMMINMTDFPAAAEFAIGSDTWKVFPMASKLGASGQVSSGVAGFAYKKV